LPGATQSTGSLGALTEPTKAGDLAAICADGRRNRSRELVPRAGIAFALEVSACGAWCAVAR
jgi:hypothetical protein